MFTEYDENEIGPLDCEEIEGDISQEDIMVLRLADEQFDKRSKVGKAITSVSMKIDILFGKCLLICK